MPIMPKLIIPTLIRRHLSHWDRACHIRIHCDSVKADDGVPCVHRKVAVHCNGVASHYSNIRPNSSIRVELDAAIRQSMPRLHGEHCLGRGQEAATNTGWGHDTMARGT